jgi:hypothetical protein
MAGAVVHVSVFGRPGSRGRGKAQAACSSMGFDRCLWRMDWTRVFAVVNYEQAVEPFLKTDRLMGH